MLEQLKARYGKYEQEAKRAREKASGFDGLFGMGADPKKHPCHDQFYEDVQAWVSDFLAGEPSGQEAAEAAEWIIRAAASHRDEEVYWYMYAVQGHACPLIPHMSADRCRALLQWYDEAYPAIDRMPVQRSVYKLLRKCGKAKK